VTMAIAVFGNHYWRLVAQRDKHPSIAATTV
jgi:hypothetical protein